MPLRLLCFARYTGQGQIYEKVISINLIRYYDFSNC